MVAVAVAVAVVVVVVVAVVVVERPHGRGSGETAPQVTADVASFAAGGGNTPRGTQAAGEAPASIMRPCRGLYGLGMCAYDGAR